MKVSIKSFVSLCAIYFLTSGLALAEAEVVIDGVCGMLDEDGIPGVSGTDALSVSANNVNGNITITCSQDIERSEGSKRSVIFNFDNTDGLKCRVSSNPLIRTEDWHQVISASGKAKLTCHYKL